MRRFWCVICLMAWLLLMTGSAQASGDPAFSVSTATAVPGDTVELTVSLKNNPGIASAKLEVIFPEELQLDSITYNSQMGGMTMEPQVLSSPVTLNWLSPLADLEGDMVYATLTFAVAENAAAAEYPVTVRYDANNVFDLTEENVYFSVESGGVTVVAETGSENPDHGDGIYWVALALPTAGGAIWFLLRREWIWEKGEIAVNKAFNRGISLLLALVMVFGMMPLTAFATEATEETTETVAIAYTELFDDFCSTDFFLKSGTLSDGNEYIVPIYSNTNNARMAVIPLEDGATYHIQVKNNGDEATNRMRIATFAEEFSELTIAPLASDQNMTVLDPATFSVAQEIVFWEENKGADCVSEYSGVFVNSNNAKTLILFTAWGADPSLVEVSVKVESAQEENGAEGDTDNDLTYENVPADANELFEGFCSVDFFLKAGTLSDGENHIVAIYSNTNNARMTVIPLQDGATYFIHAKNNGETTTNRMRIVTFAEEFSELTIAPLASDRDMTALDPATISVAQDIVYWEENKGADCVSEYSGVFVNSGNAKTLVLFTAWGADTSSVEVSVKSADHQIDDETETDNSAMQEMIRVLMENMDQENHATQAIMQIACNFWEHRDEFIYCSGTALDQPWNYWSYTGYVDSSNTGKTVTAENSGYKRIDCSTFVRYVINGIDYYSTPYYNMLELTDVEQGGLEAGAEIASDDSTICRTGQMYIRPGKKLILETKSTAYSFTKIYGYDASGEVIQTLDSPSGNTVFVPDEGVVYLRAEMKVSAASDYTPASTGTPAAILKCLRIRENERLEVNAECPLSGCRNANQMCQWFDNNGYAVEYDVDSFDADDLRVGTVIFWGRSTGTWAYKNITHTSLYIGGGYVLHVSAPNGLVGGEGILIEHIDVLMERYDIPLAGISSPAYHTAEVSHTYTPTITAPTCTGQGYTTYTCECGDSYVDDYVDAEGHSFGEWYTIAEPTLTADGKQCRECPKCSHVEFQSFPLTVVTSGNLGYGTEPTDNVTYTLYSNGTLIVEGEGKLFNCYWDGRYQPFIDYRDQIKHIVIGEGITATTSGCFAHLKNLETVDFPSSLKSLLQNAFMSSFVESLTEFTIPATVTHIGSYSFGHYGGEESAYFTDVVIENPDINITDHKAVFNGGAMLNTLTLYSYGTENNVSAYAEKYGINYVDLDSYTSGTVGQIEYMIYDGVLTFSTTGENVIIPAGEQPWNAHSNEITKIVISDGITGIADDAFVNYPALDTVELPDSFLSIGTGAFSVTEGESVPLTLTIPKRIETLGSNIFAGRTSVNLTTYYGSIAAELSEANVTLTVKKQFKLLFIGNSYSQDASNGSHTTESQTLDILQAMLGEDAEIIVGLCCSGGKGINWHATQAEQGNSSYSFRVITSGGEWKTIGSYTSADALAWTDWDVVSLQHYGLNTSTGMESIPYPETTDEKFYLLETASEFMLDHIDLYAPYAEIYFYMHWVRTKSTVLNASLSKYNTWAEYIPVVLDYEGTESGAKFTNIVPVGLSIQNARTTYLALLQYNTTAYDDGNLNLNTDAQIGLQRDGGHVSFNIGRYIAGLTFAEMVVPEEMRAEGYVLPDIRVTESVGRLPRQYTEIAQKAVWAAVDNWKNGSLAVTEIEGYTEDPTVAAAETLTATTLEISCGNTQEQIVDAVLALLPADFAVDAVEMDGDVICGQEFACQVTIRFGYTSLTVTVQCAVAGHTYENGICTGCGENNWPKGDYAVSADTMADGTKLILTELNTVKTNKHMMFMCDVAELGDGVIRLGHGTTSNYSQYIEITADALRVCTYYKGLSSTEYSHGLEINGQLVVYIDVGSNGKATITIVAEGEEYVLTRAWSYGCNGEIFCAVEGTEVTNVDCRWYCDGFDSEIWFFGDSYFNTTNSNRWPYYMTQDGYSDLLLCGYGGMGATAALKSFKNALPCGTPKYAVWCMGMNNGDKTSTTPNATWLSATEEFLALCEAYGITPILATIPSTPTVNNAPKNAWVKDSGYRYIDFDYAVVENYATNEWYEGFLSTDNVHPAKTGAEQLYLQVLLDFPELMGETNAECSHILRTVSAKNATCQWDGCEAFQLCTLCGKRFDLNDAALEVTEEELLIEQTGHTYENGLCTGCGEEDPDFYIPGDINGDGQVNNKDLTRLFQYLSDYDVEVVEVALDVNGDGAVNNKDLTRLFQYLSDYDVELH